jgi:hypothetical protein
MIIERRTKLYNKACSKGDYNVNEYVSKKNKKSIILFIHGFTSSNDTWTNASGQSLPDVLLQEEKISEHFDIAYISYYTELTDFIKARTGMNLFRSVLSKSANYVPRNNDILSIADIVHSHILLSYDDYENIILVAHSMGGLISKSCILKNIEESGTPEKIKLFLSLAVPHSGSNWATLGRKLFKNHQINNLAPLNKTLDKLNRNWIELSDSVPKTIYFYGQDDVIVPTTSAVAIGASSLIRVACDDDHFSITKPDRVSKNTIVGIKKHLIEFAKDIELSQSMEPKKFQDEGQYDNELFAIKLLIADVHSQLVSLAKESFYNAEYLMRALVAQGVSRERLEGLYRLLKQLYTTFFMDLKNGKFNNSDELVNEVHKEIMKQDDKLLANSSLAIINSYQKTGMLHQLANRLDEDIWWAINHSIKTVEEFRKEKGYE